MLNNINSLHILNVIKHIREELTDIETKIMEEEIPSNSIFPNKKAIIGNYDTFQSNELKKILESFGMEVEIYKTGSEILEFIKNGYKCDVIFTNNTYQKGIQGQELLKELKKIDGFDIPIIVHTIETNQKHIFKDIIGFDEYIEKPIVATFNEKVLEIKNILEKFFK